MISTIRKLFRLSDLLLIIWAVFGTLIFLEDYRFVYDTYGSLLEFNTPFYLIVIYFVLLVASLVLYLLFEYKKTKFSINRVFILAFFILIILQIENIFLSLDTYSFSILDIENEPFTVSARFNLQVKFTHFFTVFFILTTIFIGVFIFSKRFNHVKTISIAIYIFFALAIVALVYSIIKDDYVLLFKVLTLQQTVETLKKVCPSSVFGNPNTYAMFLEVCFFLSIVNFVITRNKINIVFGISFYAHLMLTICKAGIVAATIVIPLIFAIFALQSLSNKKWKTAIIYGSIFLGLSVILLGSYLVLKSTSAYDFLFEESDSFSGRNKIWYSSLQIISRNSFVYGYGYGIYNSLIANSCARYGYDNCPISHNWFLAMLGEGGLFYVIPYLTLLIYVSIVVVKNWKDKTIITLGVSCFGFFVHTFFEDSYYILISLMVLLLIINNIKVKEKNKKASNA